MEQSSPADLFWKTLRADYRACSGEASFRFKFLLHPGFQVSFFYRLSRYFHLKGYLVCARWISAVMRWVTHCDIHHGADLGPGVMFPHGTGVVVGEGAIIGARCSLFQFTTIGSLEGQGGAPILEEGVNVYPGCVLAGNIRIGEYCRIGPNVYLTESVLSHTRISPAKPHLTRKDPHVQL